MKKPSDEIQEYYNSLVAKEEKYLNRKMRRGLDLLGYWERKLSKENKKLFNYTLTKKIPYWKHWVKKHKTMTYSMHAWFREKWAIYKELKALDALVDEWGRPLQRLF